MRCDSRSIGPSWPPPSLAELRRTDVARVRRELGDRFDDEVEAGGRLSPTEAVELAFEVCDAH